MFVISSPLRHDLPTEVACPTLQEKTYNPYYTLVCQELCRFSHSYKITLQFCLWDFLRELGESNVGGVELLKRRDELGFSPQGKSIGRCRLKNTARAYSWWVAKDCCSLAIFKVFRFHCPTFKPHANEVNSLLTFQPSRTRPKVSSKNLCCNSLLTRKSQHPL